MTAEHQPTAQTPAETGLILPADSFPVRLPLHFRFSCFGVPFEAHAQRGADGTEVAVHGEVGPLPFSAESVQARQNITAILQSADVGSRARFVVGDGQAIMVEGRASLGAMPSPETIVATVATMLYPLKPYIELVDWFGRFGGNGAAVS